MGKPRRVQSSLGVIAGCLTAIGLMACACTSSDGAGGEAGGGSLATGGASAGSGPSSNTSGATASAGAAAVAGAATAGSAGAPGSAGSAGAVALAGASAGGNSSTSGAGGSLGVAGSGTGGSANAAGAAGAPSSCPVGTPNTGGTKYCSNKKGNVGSTYSYELWASGAGSGCMTVFNADAKFSATWSGVDDFLARIGLGFDQSKTPAQIGTLSADFAETKTGGDGLVYVGIYGWTVSPLREYYILDDWGSTKPADTASDGTPRTKVGTITVDDGTYDVWKHTRTNKPAITGDNQTFDQYYSIRQTARSCGHISISEHFSQWTKLGLELGKLEEAKILLEAQDSTGSIDFTTATVTLK